MDILIATETLKRVRGISSHNGCNKQLMENRYWLTDNSNQYTNNE